MIRPARSLPPGVTADTPGPGQESVWDYPRPAVAEPTPWRLQVIHRGTVVADTVQGVRTLETSHPPTYYFPPDDVTTELLRPARGRSLCEWKGAAAYFDVVVGDEILPQAAWRYPSPSPSFARLAGFFAFYPGAFESCLVDGETVTPQAGGFYGGWITSHVAGPFKGGPGSRFW
jgi:uncharacterized protein (DUF427 family)